MFSARRKPAFDFIVDALVGPRSLKCCVFLAVINTTLESGCGDSFLYVFLAWCLMYAWFRTAAPAFCIFFN